MGVDRRACPIAGRGLVGGARDRGLRRQRCFPATPPEPAIDGALISHKSQQPGGEDDDETQEPINKKDEKSPAEDNGGGAGEFDLKADAAPVSPSTVNEVDLLQYQVKDDYQGQGVDVPSGARQGHGQQAAGSVARVRAPHVRGQVPRPQARAHPRDSISLSGRRSRTSGSRSSSGEGHLPHLHNIGGDIPLACAGSPRRLFGRTPQTNRPAR